VGDDLVFVPARVVLSWFVRCQWVLGRVLEVGGLRLKFGGMWSGYWLIFMNGR